MCRARCEWWARVSLAVSVPLHPWRMAAACCLTLPGPPPCRPAIVRAASKSTLA